MNEVEIPEYFLCPISLQIMKDPVTTITGITYDRASIEQWLLTSVAGICPVTNQELTRESLLTPNHTLRRLIQCWCTVNGVDRIPTPQPPLSKSHVAKLLRRLNSSSEFLASVKKLEAVATSSSSSDRKCLMESDVERSMVNLLIRLCKEEKTLIGVRETLRILYLVLTETVPLEIVESLTWVLNAAGNDTALRTHTVIMLQKISEVSSSTLTQRLDAGFFKAIVESFDRGGLSLNATLAGLTVLVHAAKWGRNRATMITDAGLVHALIEMELSLSVSEERSTRKAVTEMTMGLLSRLCTCADGRERLMGHRAGVALVAKRLLRVSPETDHAAVGILAALARSSSGKGEVVGEMLKLGAVAKLCMVLQANSDKGLKDKAREVLRLHYGHWNNSPCIQMYLITRYPTL